MHCNNACLFYYDCIELIVTISIVIIVKIVNSETYMYFRVQFDLHDNHVIDSD